MRFLLLCSSLLLAHISLSEELDVDPRFEDSELKKTTREIELVDPEEIPADIRENLPSLVEKFQTERAAANNRFVLLPHRPNYVMPLTYQTKPSDEEWDRLLEGLSDGEFDGSNTEFDHVEAVFQISVKYILAEGLLGKYSSLEFGYTNRSFWQAYNKDISAPFRETNHEPELMLNWQPKHLSWLDLVGISLNHQSNGQTATLSRSWNRVIGYATNITEHGLWHYRVWWRIPETDDADPFDPRDNDNPDIDDYMGPGEIAYTHVMGNHHLTTTARNNFNFDENRGALQLEWSFPVSKRLRGYVHYFNGYGESLIDYNRYQERFGLGIQLSDWL
ncbi:phospholipase A [Bacterioplanoides sp. SCSIO 12839]|uniref:phospholipase A n=1 Tax=Bacterioplanoides sp. SCSIO 12839 TaxID=2829569 RepID=UPI002102201D|nr:phospholipase A [Bacterioplanoides sp. SCSIO 12839]UTW47231.1 phospholipase A [Bacterioplanoides sp. SCSIO 12839]